MNNDKILVNFRIREVDAEELKQVAEQMDIPQSQIIREAVREKVADLKQKIEAETVAPATA